MTAVGAAAAAAAGAGASMAGAALNYIGAREANATNKKIAREQMGFQERMSNTAYQRGVEDLKKAGLNPALMYNMGGASTPPGSSTAVKNEFSGAVSSALQWRRVNAELDNMLATNENLRSQNSKLQHEIKLLDAQTDGVHLDNSAKGLLRVGLETERKIDESPYGQFMRYLNRLNPLNYFKGL